MAFKQVQGNTVGQVGRQPRRYTVCCTHTLSQVVAANFLQTQLTSTDPLYPTDVVEVLYGTNSASYGIFRPTISGNDITLVPWVNGANVLLPVVDAHIAAFNGTTGQIEDSGATLSNPAKTKIVMANAALVVNNVVLAADTAGTVKDGGYRILAGDLTWAGGSASNAFTLTGITSSSIVIPVIKVNPNSVSIVGWTLGTDTITITFSANPGAVTVAYVAATLAVA
jgi:hypothetical protein